MLRESRCSSRIMGSESWALSWLGLGLGSSLVLSLGADGLPPRVRRQLFTWAQVGVSLTGGTTQSHRLQNNSWQLAPCWLSWSLTNYHWRNFYFSAEAHVCSVKTCLVPGRPRKYSSSFHAFICQRLISYLLLIFCQELLWPCRWWHCHLLQNEVTEITFFMKGSFTKTYQTNKKWIISEAFHPPWSFNFYFTSWKV